MAKLNKQDLINKVTAYIGDRTDDESLSILEDITDSVPESSDDMVSRADYDALDTSWREKYKARFSGEEKKADDADKPEETEEKTDVSIEDLFK